MALTQTQEQEIQDSQSQTSSTRRDTSPRLEEVLYEAFPVLDHGFVRVIDYMGTDSAIVQAARVSYGKGTKKSTEDRGLIHYLLRHAHTTPFEMCEIKFHIKLPFFIARQWLRHRTANVNEYSARYSILDKEFYIPSIEHLAAQSSTNKQGRGQLLSPEYSRYVIDLLKNDAEHAYAHYEELLNEDAEGSIRNPQKEGLTRELARTNLSLNFYTQMYWKIDLHNLMHFLTLRGDAHAQYEIRAYADVMLTLLERWVPFTYEAFLQYRKESARFSKNGVETLKRLLKGEPVTQETSGMSKREWQEFSELLDLPL
ncbi:MAG: FAD-dependent thymidylate synthase [Alphaproteobacteria bacterium]|jgi:thymidylate synthase (FAD)|nr:FAD-dependent thymidylate synthase [Alphaproteobacteria bacterium]MBP9776512.1 FAD-dependent thymidylate synthase [Alphaproteobacteria bacterium]